VRNGWLGLSMHYLASLIRMEGSTLLTEVRWRRVRLFPVLYLYVTPPFSCVLPIYLQALHAERLRFK
jgi:hypothetical protein